MLTGNQFFMHSNITGSETMIWKQNEILFNVSIHFNFDKTAGIHYSIEQVKTLKAYPWGE